MRISGSWIGRQIAGFLVVSLTAPFGFAASTPLQQTLPDRLPESAAGHQIQSQDQDNKPPATMVKATQSEEAYPDSPVAAQSQAIEKTAQSPTLKAGTEQQQTGTPQPVGTAVAPYAKTTGVAASRPAGVVIAPGKQRRARSILIRVSIVVGAAVAVGTVVALSTSSHSQP